MKAITPGSRIALPMRDVGSALVEVGFKQLHRENTRPVIKPGIVNDSQDPASVECKVPDLPPGSYHVMLRRKGGHWGVAMTAQVPS